MLFVKMDELEIIKGKLSIGRQEALDVKNNNVLFGFLLPKRVPIFRLSKKRKLHL